MNAIEDRIAAATRAAAETVPEGSAPPLQLPARPEAGGSRSRGLGPLPRRSWLPPAAAAAAVVAVAATAALVAGLGAASVGAHGTHQQAAAPARQLPPVARAADLDGVPSYFLRVPQALQIAPGKTTPRFRLHQLVEIVATTTGRVTATATLPGAVSQIAASQSAFYALVYRGQAARFYQIQLLPGGASTTVTQLPIPAITAFVDQIAVSPDGSKVAVETYTTTPGQPMGTRNIIVASAATGLERRWSTPEGSGTGDAADLSWLTDNQTLQFNWDGGSGPEGVAGVRLLNTSRPGGDLLSAGVLLPRAKVVLLPSTAGYPGEWLSPDGHVVIALVGYLGNKGLIGGQYGTFGGQWVVDGSIAAIAAPAGHVTVLWSPPTVVPPRSGPLSGLVLHIVCNPPNWISNSGQELLISCAGPIQGRGFQRHLTAYTVLVRNGQVFRVPWLAGLPSQRTVFGYK